MTKNVSVMEEDWDYLIVLDACRYDYFAGVYRDYLSGRLKKRVSLASSTLEWCQRSFQKRYDCVIYISANPYINSEVETKGFAAKNHFHKVIDVWKGGWDEKLGTVHPKEVNKAVQRSRRNYPDKRFIIHYLQPHAPYLRDKLPTRGFPRPKINQGQILAGIENEQPLSIMKKSLLKIIDFFAKRSGFLGENLSWRIRELLNLPPAGPMDAVRRSVGNVGLQEAYVQNLRFVLKHVASLVDKLYGVIIITADHGELLGEGMRYSHCDGLSDPFLIEVPWFEVEKTGKSKKHYEDNEKKRIAQRIRELRALGKL